MRTALITGSSTGIGFETALLLAGNGFRVFAGARNPSKAHLLQETASRGLPLVPVELDVDRDESVSRAVASVLEQAGQIDVLVNNAGIGGAGALEMYPIEEARAIMETNFFGAIRVIQAVLPHMRERRAGTVVNVTSIMGRLTLGFHGFYTASKFALTAASEALAVEVQPFGIRVAVIEPGVILTPIWNKVGVLMPAGHPYQLAERRLMRLFGSQLEDGTTPDVVARAILDAIETDTPRLHYLVGPDAVAMMAGREKMDGQQWIELQAEPDDHLFVARAKDAFALDLYHPPSLFSREKTAKAGV